MTPRRSRGFSLIEVLIALLVFTVGLLGLAGLLAVSVKTNHSAYQRTQASFIAQSMADRMRANSRAIWSGDYAGSFTGSIAAVTGCGAASPCDFSALAVRDKQAFNRDLSSALPAPSATIACARGAGSTPADMSGRPPYDGLCTIVITWKEAALMRDAQAPADQTFAWKFQP